MQAYAQMIDKNLSYDDLPGLGVRLEVTQGLALRSMVPASTWCSAGGRSMIVQDDLDDTYQKID